ncbi:hypothetical protein [Caulobacter sp. LARHSG274]
MIWTMREKTAARLREHANRRARREARERLIEELADFPFAFSMLSDAAQDTLVAAVRTLPKAQARVFDLTSQASAALRSVASVRLPALSVFVGWQIDEDAAALMTLSDGLELLRKYPGFFSLDGCLITAPDGSVAALFEFDMPFEVSEGGVQLLGQSWPPGLLDV